MNRLAARYVQVALSIVGSAILLFSCDGNPKSSDEAANESLMTEYSEDLTVVMSENGRRSYLFTTPLLEGFTEAREPYREFRRGVKITTYQDDSLSTVNATLTANYAIYYTDRELWEAKGNVVVTRSDGRTLYTQQLFWNAKTKRIYSNVDSKIVTEGTREEFFGEGFESDEEFKDWRFRRNKIRMEVDVKPTETDSTAVAAPAEEAQSAPKSTQPEPQSTRRNQTMQLPRKDATTPASGSTSTAWPARPSRPSRERILETRRRAEAQRPILLPDSTRK